MAAVASSPVKVTGNTADRSAVGPGDPALLSLLSSKTRVLGEAASWSESGARAICPLEAGVDRGGDGTFVERIAVLLPVELLPLLLKAAVFSTVVDFHR